MGPYQEIDFLMLMNVAWKDWFLTVGYQSSFNHSELTEWMFDANTWIFLGL